MPISHVLGVATTTIGTPVSFTLLDARDDSGSTVRSPLILGQNEGFKVRNTILMGATGVATLVFNIEWDEYSL